MSDDETIETETAPEPTTAPTPAPEHTDRLGSLIDRLETFVTGLETAATQTVVAPTTIVEDEKPVGTPWIHRKVI